MSSSRPKGYMERERDAIGSRVKDAINEIKESLS